MHSAYEEFRKHEPSNDISLLNGYEYSVESIWNMAKGCPVQTMDIEAFNFDWFQPPRLKGLLEFSCHVERVLKADLDYPIILSPFGALIDGRHRLTKLLLEGADEIKYIRLTKMPEPIGTYDEGD